MHARLPVRLIPLPIQLIYTLPQYSTSVNHPHRNRKKGVSHMTNTLLESGGDLLSRAVSSQVPSALRGLTSVFGMGTGGTLSPLPPEIVFSFIVPDLLSFPFRFAFLPDTLYTHLYNCTVRVDLNASSRFPLQRIFPARGASLASAYSSFMIKPSTY